MNNPADSPCPNCGASREGLRNATHDFINDCPACRGPGCTGYVGRTSEYEKALDLALKVRAEKHAEVAASIVLSALREAQPKDSGSETPSAQGQPREETGLLPCPFCGSEAKHETSLFLPKRGKKEDVHWHNIRCSGSLSGRPPVVICEVQPRTVGVLSYERAKGIWNKRVSLIPSRSTKSTLSGEKEKPVAQPSGQEKWAVQDHYPVNGLATLWMGEKTIGFERQNIEAAKRIANAHNASLSQQHVVTLGGSPVTDELKSPGKSGRPSSIEAEPPAKANSGAQSPVPSVEECKQADEMGIRYDE